MGGKSAVSVRGQRPGSGKFFGAWGGLLGGESAAIALFAWAGRSFCPEGKNSLFGRFGAGPVRPFPSRAAPLRMTQWGIVCQGKLEFTLDLLGFRRYF